MLLTHLSLFSGIGGIDLASEWAGFTTVGQVEMADYPTKVLEKHWPDVPRWRDIKDVTRDSFREKTGLETVELISGGVPCQPFSVAGKQKGKGDSRYLWPEMLRVVQELSPRWVLVENVPGVLKIAGRTICEDLECAGYSVTVFDYEAAAVGAPHRRERVFFVGHSEHHGSPTATLPRRPTTPSRDIPQGTDKTLQSKRTSRHGDYENVANAGQQSKGAEIGGSGYKRQDRRATRVGTEAGYRLTDSDEDVSGEWWAVEPNVGRVAHGIPSRVDRLKCLGNAVVPHQAYPILRAITDM